MAQANNEMVTLTRELLNEFKNFGEITVATSRVIRDNSEILHDIHNLVNSEKTAALKRELRSIKRELILLKELGRPFQVIDETQNVIVALEQVVQEREEAQKRMELGG